MPRRNVDGGWGESRPTNVRIGVREEWALRRLREHWQCSEAEAIRRAIRETARRLESDPPSRSPSR